ncbi:MAG: asparagine synthase (glutamine-hydrolyzing) [Candidatus Omnitrophica bacterium]|nr:asparagine synthase (glutamine-hydrolyzing) [Candidatus Omnitrophota bacterium]
MCGIAGIYSVNFKKNNLLEKKLKIMNKLVSHRGPDGSGTWISNKDLIGLTHRRLSIIDLSENASQPMIDKMGNVIVFNGEIYNYKELRDELKDDWDFKSKSDTEVILALYYKYKERCLEKLRGMFSFAIWDDKNKRLFCARDRFGIKPFYYVWKGKSFYFASEAKALLPFIEKILDYDALKEYLFFQFYLEGKTLFKDIKELQPGHFLIMDKKGLSINRYWEIYYDIDYYHTEKYFIEELEKTLEESISYHVISDVPVSAYVSGGLDSSLVAIKSSKYVDYDFYIFHGKFSYSSMYDESKYAKEVARLGNFNYFEIDITHKDFVDNIRKVIYHLDFPVAGPGSFPQYMVSRLASHHRKVVLSGQGGDEIFGGYARYLIAYFEQCIKAAIEGTLKNGNFVVTYESIIPNLISLKNYKPLIQEFWKEGLFESMDKRYFRLINRAPDLKDEVNWDVLGANDPFIPFAKIFNGSNVGKEAYFDKMTHFDFKTLLPALLQVEDRMSMAHGLESRVPILDHKVVELAARIPADIKFKNGKMKRLLIKTFSKDLPDAILKREDKMGFPVPINEWFKKELNIFVKELFCESPKRDIINKDKVIEKIEEEPRFGRKIWGLFSLELWFQEFYDKFYDYKKII